MYHRLNLRIRPYSDSELRNGHAEKEVWIPKDVCEPIAGDVIYIEDLEIAIEQRMIDVDEQNEEIQVTLYSEEWRMEDADITKLCSDLQKHGWTISSSLLVSLAVPISKLTGDQSCDI